MLWLLYDMNTRRHTHRYLSAIALLFVADLVALMLSNSPLESVILFILFVINTAVLIHYTS